MSTSNPDHSLDGQSLSGLMIGLSAVLGLLCLAVVSARLYTRAILLRNAGLDDLAILFTEVIALGQNVSTILEAYWGVGRHSWLASPEDGERQLKALFGAIQSYIWSLCLVKVSLLLQYRRIFPAMWLQRATFYIICFACTWNIVQSVLVSLGCVPLSNLYPSMANHCIDSLTIWYIAAGINITTDFIVFALPISLINSLQLPRRQKILLIMVFCLGFFTCIISIVRATTLSLVVDTDDASWYGAYAAIWSMVEVNCAILCACLPTIRHLLALLLPCLGLRSEVSQYMNQHQLSSRSRRISGVFALSRRSRRAGGSDIPPTPHLDLSHDKTIGGSSDREAVAMPQQRHDSASGLDPRWDGGVDVEKPGLYYHSNQISAWISASPDAGGASTPGGRRRSEGEESDVQRLVYNRASDRDLGQHILVTKETLVVEEARDTTTISRTSDGCEQEPERTV